MTEKKQSDVDLVDRIEPCILRIREQRVMLDADLAALYGSTTKAFNQAVKRNSGRFPADFMFQLTAEEAETMRLQPAAADLRSQCVTSSSARHGGRRYRPYAFTEHGAIMAACVLNTPQAIDASVFVVRAFVKLRELLSTHEELAGKLAELERKIGSHDGAIQSLVAAIRQLMQPPPAPPRPRIGIHVTPQDASRERRSSKLREL